MPILELQKRARELGRIRIGQKGDRGQPQKLDRFRLTSPSKVLIEKVASLYGGTAHEWTPAGGAQQWEVVTDSRRLPIMVPPQPVTQWLETWTGGGCVHRCDGITEVITGEPCDLGPVHEAAKPTTRLNVVLRDVEGIGVWRLESHGWNAAVELPDVAAFLAQAGGYVNGWLSLEERVSKSVVDGKAQTRRFIVPTIEIDVTPAQLMAGGGRVAAPQVEGPVVLQAIEAGPLAGAELDDIRAAARACTTGAAVRDLYRRLHEQVRTGKLILSEDALTAILKARADEIDAAASSDPGAEPEPPDLDAAWLQCVATAGDLGWTTDQLTDHYADQHGGELPDGASYVELIAYYEVLRALKGAAA